MSCCSDLPPVQAEYTPKGTYTTSNGLKTYVTGPEDAKAAVLYIYDIFGFSPQILQGADLIASQGYRVVMPDFLVGNYATPAFFGPGTEEKRKQYFSQFPAAFATQSKPLADSIAGLKAAGYSRVAVLGACWGYKAALTSEGVSNIDVFLATSPAFPVPEDAEKINVPALVLSTSGEDKSIINAIEKGVEAKNPGKNVFKRYDDQAHGFTSARADLSGGATLAGYVEAYQLIVKFLKEHL
ncbi:hypothetical protein L202_00664 [Cryptococcus amylolentus CBS 6039]|uniref:Dienelactone hydrolase domain-containing protein n=2 Tax=Cryptococcus amylolentus TaxID=104669 RepID=A0A1E3I7V3_9TREE|nr:hypothetical protein L202_00664 [Cryptococcus amylolentus CBS 6039]ODN84793.1 hypothetical protein L202_00664 [Cryptococcus amylolentus CBS 6039]ODO11481.1 hypothetical protein I350_00261 [Cryptococcus amylolentus CBS 6273]